MVMSHGFRFGLIYPRTVPRESTPLSFNAVVSFIQKGEYSTFNLHACEFPNGFGKNFKGVKSSL